MMAIKFGKQRLNTYNKYKQRAQRKLRKLEKQFGDRLDTGIKIPDANSFESVKEFNAWKRQIDSFTNRYNTDYQYVENEKGLIVTKREYKTIKANSEIADRKLKDYKKRIGALPYFSNGESEFTVKQVKGPEVFKRDKVGEIYNLAVFEFDKLPSRNVFDDKMRIYKERSTNDFYEKRNRRVKSDWLWIIGRVFNSDADELIKKVGSLSDKDFIELYSMVGEYDFENYGSDGELYDESIKVEKLEMYVDAFIEGKLHKDFTLF